MSIGETVRHSTWYGGPVGRRVMSDTAPFFSISEPDDGDRDAQRRRSLTTTAGLGA
jgi:hypothetical protein